jgi:hypothetical protein
MYRIDIATLHVTEIASLIQGSALSARNWFSTVFFNEIIYIFGGIDATGQRSDFVGFAIQRTISLPEISSVSMFMQVYDWDILKAEAGTTVLPQRLELCFGSLPCAIKLSGSDGSVLRLEGQGSISCRISNGCTSLTLESLRVKCSAMLTAFDIQGSRLHVTNSSFDSCSSNEEGGTITAYYAAEVVIIDSLFTNSWSSSFGGAVSLVGVKASFDSVTFINCTSTKGGGAISMSGFTMFRSPPIATAAKIYNCHFQACKSGVNGGALLASTDLVSVLIKQSTFNACVAANMGGAVAAADLVKISISHSLFQYNKASGIGGGALYCGNAPSLLLNITCLGNNAHSGGGGAIFWGGEFEPKFQTFADPAEVRRSLSTNKLPSNLCEGDSAAYGPCIASTYKSLQVQNIMKGNRYFYPGLSFSLKVVKKDYYNQTIVSDSSSVIQIFLQEELAFYIIGSTVSVISVGEAVFSIAIKPNFLQVIPCNDSSLLYSTLFVYVEGVDVITKLNMISKANIIPLSSCNDICPKGHILQLEQAGTKGTPGSCTRCSAGAYTLSPLVGSATSSDTPSCLKCPAGADCSAGGDQVTFALGSWSNMKGIYYLNACPLGHQLINSTTGTSYGLFSHDNQQCRPCKPNQYIIDQMQTCQTCPTGATCDGTNGQLTGLPGSYWRREGDKMRVHRCDPGFILVRDDAQNGALAFLDSCAQCLPSTYSLLGAQVIDLKPCKWTGELGQPYNCTAVSDSNIAAISDSNINGSWTSYPGLAQQLCLKCPIGAKCPGGSAIIPEQGFWMDNPSISSEEQGGAMAKSREVTVFKCPPEACDKNGTCYEGRKGPLCALCDNGWAMSSNNCEKCPTDPKAYEAQRILGAIGAVLVLGALFYYFSFRSLFMEEEKASVNEFAEESDFIESDEVLPSNTNLEAQSWHAVKEMSGEITKTMNQFFKKSEVLLFLQGYFKVIISFFQVLSTFANNLRVGWPSAVSDLFRK